MKTQINETMQSSESFGSVLCPVCKEEIQCEVLQVCEIQTKNYELCSCGFDMNKAEVPF